MNDDQPQPDTEAARTDAVQEGRQAGREEVLTVVRRIWDEDCPHTGGPVALDAWYAALATVLRACNATETGDLP